MLTLGVSCMGSRVALALIAALQASVSAAYSQTAIPYYGPASVCPADASAKVTNYVSKDDAYDD
jgi:hypothetical protein